MEKGGQSDIEMIMSSARLKTFTNWPFTEDCSCLPERMAEAGFYCCGGDNEPDLVRCYFCRKELDGWEPGDDPWEEHVSHAKGRCAFVALGKRPKDLTVKDVYSLDPEKLGTIVRKMVEARAKEFRKQASEGRRQLIETLL